MRAAQEATCDDGQPAGAATVRKGGATLRGQASERRHGVIRERVETPHARERAQMAAFRGAFGSAQHDDGIAGLHRYLVAE